MNPASSQNPTCVCVLGTDLAEPVTWALVRCAEDVRSQQGLQRGADGDEQQLGVEVAGASCCCRGKFAEGRLHGQNTCRQNLRPAQRGRQELSIMGSVVQFQVFVKRQQIFSKSDTFPVVFFGG